MRTFAIVSSLLLAATISAQTIECAYVNRDTIIDIDIRLDTLSGNLEADNRNMDLACVGQQEGAIECQAHYSNYIYYVSLDTRRENATVSRAQNGSVRNFLAKAQCRS